ncbi:hypothetical protein N7532_003633 [Penicillium argentinense]|uniref:Uncharacterized protein n=1 Tax=Penicillium argentinense TaxID=1131581 RepID=A0A9W9FMS1_9EURO|nr:uncharacterized protein N7532_003633 [Penicillium argentinense]KAJ5103104.1 hypothetical protein N7532_003633 [Penicillium argentinense]
MLVSNTILQWPTWSTLFCVSFCSSLLLFISTVILRRNHTTVSRKHESHIVSETIGYPPVEPLRDFDWQKKEPVKIRPFKPKYNMTMSIQEATVNELIEMDKNYLDRIMLRRNLIAEHSDTVLAAEDSVKPAVNEFYTWLIGTYLPTRFPSMFQLRLSPSGEPSTLYNTVTDEELPVSPGEEPTETLRVLGGLIDDDILFLMPSEDGDGFTLKGFVTCFPNGFNTAKKLNMKLRDIHRPVPNYKEKLEKSMDRYFQRLQPGKFVKRANWTITTTNQLFTASGNHLYEGEELPQEHLDINLARVRVERQFLHRLAESRAIIFSFKTLLYTLPEIKEEGLGEALAEAIDGLKQGNAPGFHFYKRAAVWGESAKAYLRGA